ncbi:cystatin-B [Carlito syrichta]|uniref:Cystatin-B n=1 Tax=Carlito syrichta TaxID=1868482 RepID=A0A1U7TB45_CARSF|nr:cystatin-B [Carlito syrichta]
MMCGAPTSTQPATDEIQHIADQVKSQLEKKENKTFPVFKAMSFKSQLVAGTNYFIKVHVGGDVYIHLRVFRSLPHENQALTLSDYQTNKAQHDELSYF